MPTKICILTTVHPPFDTRIFHKQAKTLVKAGYDVTLIAQHERDEVVDGVKIIALPKLQNRFMRMFGLTWRAFRLALRQQVDIYHFHDPELIPVGLLLKLLGNKVIYDIHEDYITSITQKRYLPKGIRKILANLFGCIEVILSNFFELILAEKYYLERFPCGTRILNYPILQQWDSINIITKKDDTKPRLIYTGGITIDRGAIIHANIVNLIPNIEVWMVGFCDRKLADQLYDIASGNSDRLYIEGIGYRVPYQRILKYYTMSKWTAGLAVFPPTKHYLRKELTKFFEYMANGIPIITSNFPTWKRIMEGNNCGLCVDPLNPKEVADAIEYFLTHPEEVKKMGENGRRAVEEKYNWEKEAKKLLNLYEELLKR